MQLHYGVSAAASQSTKPVEVGGGTVAGNATVMGTQEVSKITVKETLKQAANAVKEQGLKTISKNTIKELGKHAMKHPIQALRNINSLKNSISNLTNTISNNKHQNLNINNNVDINSLNPNIQPDIDLNKLI